MINDFHVHIHEDVSAKETEKYLTYFKNTIGIEHIVLQSVPTIGAVSRLQNLKILLLKDMMYPYAFAGFGLYHGDDLDYLTQLLSGLEQGFDSVKILESKPDIRKEFGKPMDDPSLDAFYSCIEEKGLPLLMHVADPIKSWDRTTAGKWAIEHGRCYDAPGFCTKEELYGEVERMLEKHPKLKVVFAHFYFLDEELPRAAAFLDSHPNVKFDLTPGGHYECFSKDPTKAREFFIKYADRLVYGTDVNDTIIADKGPTYNPVGMYHEKLYRMTVGMVNGDPIPDFRGNEYHSLDLPKEVCEKIFNLNFKGLMGETPKPVNKEAVRREIQRLEPCVNELSEAEQKAFKEIKEYFLKQ